MPPVIAAIATVLAAVGVPGSVATAIATAVVQVGVSLAVSAVASLFGPGVPKPASVQTARKQSRPVRVSAFGRVRVSGAYMLYEATNQTSYDVLALLDGQSDGFEGFYLNDDLVSLTGGDGVISPDGKKYSYGTPGDRVFMPHRLGLATETAYSEIVSALPSIWTSDHRGDGITSLALICKQSKPQYQQEDFPNGLPMPGAVIRAQLCRDPRDDSVAWTMNPVHQLAAYLTTASGGMGEDWDEIIAPAVDSWQEAAADCDVAVDVVAQHGIIQNDPKAASGTNSVTLSNVAGITAGTVLTFTDETKTVNHVSGSTVTLNTNLSLDHVKGEAVNWSPAAGAVTQARYRCAGVYSHDTAPADVIGALLASFDGWLAPRSDGALVIRAGKYVEPTVTLGDDVVLGYSLRHFKSDEEAVNEYLVSFTDPDAAFQQGDAGSWRDEADIAARGIARSQPLDLTWVPSAGQARRLAKRAMLRSTAELSGTITTSLGGMDALGERFLRLQVSENAAIADIVVEVTGKVSIDLSSMTLTFPFVLADPLVDEWSTAEETPGNEVNSRPVPSALAAPTIDSHAVIFDGAQARAELTVTAAGYVDLVWQVRWRRSGDADWNETTFSDIDDGPGVTLLTGLVPIDADLEFEVAYQTAAQRSPWSSTEGVDTSSGSVTPDDATSITVVSWGSAVSLIAEPIARAKTYRWKVWDTASSPAALLRTQDTAAPEWSYTNGVAASDGILRAYAFTVEGRNGAGSGESVSTGTVTKPAPGAITVGSPTGGATAIIPFTPGAESDIAGYVLYHSETSGFDPQTAGTPVTIGASPFTLYGLSVATHYFRVAAFDAWTQDPSLLNLSSEGSVAISSVSTPPSGAGGGGGGGGYAQQPPLNLYVGQIGPFF